MQRFTSYHDEKNNTDVTFSSSNNSTCKNDNQLLQSYLTEKYITVLILWYALFSIFYQFGVKFKDCILKYCQNDRISSINKSLISCLFLFQLKLDWTNSCQKWYLLHYYASLQIKQLPKPRHMTFWVQN